MGLAAGLVVWLVLLMVALAGPTLAGWALVPAIFIGLTQFAYMAPLWIWNRLRGNLAFAKGLLVSASLIFILDSACVGVLGYSPLGIRPFLR